MAQADASNTFKTIAEVEESAEGIARRWLSELALADEVEGEWRKDAKKCWELYQSKQAAANTFNIFWSNIETRRPAIYNSTPRPDVRRRFRDADPVGKVASKVLERSLAYSIDDYDFDAEIKAAVLDSEVTGRGILRVKYDASFYISQKSEKESTEEFGGEKALCQHVKWDDFRRGAATNWSQVPWVAFRHEFHYDELVSHFGEDKAQLCEMSEPNSNCVASFKDDMKSLWKVCEVWEIWDRAKRRVLFISEGFKSGPLKEVDDPLKLAAFFPMPAPLYSIEDSTTLVPAIPYRKYEQQAEELNRVTYRINRIVQALKVRGAYEASLAELPQILEAEDQDFIPIQNASQVANMGGLDKAIWIMPIDKLIQVLQGLIEARERTIQAIYEITGMGDIMRGVANPNETATAQNLKSRWGSLRLQRIQRDVQRFVRDLLRLKAEIFAEHFDSETLAAMTGVQLPSAEDKARVQQMLTQMQMMAQQGGQPPNPEEAAKAEEILKLPTWDDVMGLLKTERLRQYRIGIETDSTIAESLTQDAEGMLQAVQAIAQVAQTFAPAIQMGMISVDVAKTIMTRIARSMRMGEAVEDAIDAIKQPPPQQNAAPQDNAVQVAQIKEQGAAERNDKDNQTKLQLASMKTQTDQAKQQLEQSRTEHEARDAERQRQFEAAEAERQRQHDLQLAEMEAKFDAALKMHLGQMQQQTQMAGLESQERMGQQQMAVDASQAEADRASNESLSREKLQSSNLQAAAKIEATDRQTETKVASADRQTGAKLQSAERVNADNNKSAERRNEVSVKAKNAVAKSKPKK